MITPQAVLAAVPAALLASTPPLKVDSPSVPEPFVVPAAAETDPVPSDDDAADDAAIWVHPTDPQRSLIVATDKKSGLCLYDLSGRLIQHVPCGRVNNVDLRCDARGEALVAATNRSDRSVLIARLRPDDPQLVAVGSFPTGLGDVYGIAAARLRGDLGDELHIIVNDTDGRVEQWAVDWLAPASPPRLVRTFSVGDQTEGMVADEFHRVLYIGEENAGIWAYPLAPDTELERTLIDAVGPVGRHLRADVEGLTLITKNDQGVGWLVASSQGSDRFVVYDRFSREHLFTFSVGAAGSIDGVSGTDGIDGVGAPLGTAYPSGLLVVQDDDNTPQAQNFKLVSWAAVLAGHDSAVGSRDGTRSGPAASP